MKMMRLLGIEMLLAVVFSSIVFAGATYDGEGSIVITEKHNNLETIAEDINDENIFKYDALEKTAVCRATINIKGGGELTIGDIKKKERQTLYFDLKYVYKKDRGGFSLLRVGKGSSLNICHSEIDANRKSIVPFAARPNLDGVRMIDASTKANLSIKNSTVHGHIRVTYRTTAVIKNSTIIIKAGLVGLTLQGLEIPAEINNLTVLGQKGYKVGVRATYGTKNQTLRNLTVKNVSPHHIRVSQSSSLILVDSTLNREKIAMGLSSPRGGCACLIAHSLKCQVVDEERKPLLNVKVKVEESNLSYYGEEVKTDVNGICYLKIPECIMTNKVKGISSEKDVQLYRNEVKIDDGSGYKTVKTGWTPAKKKALRYIRKQDKSGYIEENVEFSNPNPLVNNKPSESEGAKARIVTNYIRNSSFEIATNGPADGYPGIPDGSQVGFGGGYRHSLFVAGVRWGIDETTAYHGKRSIKIHYPANFSHPRKDCMWHCVPVLLQPDDYTFSVYLKSDTPDFPVVIGISKEKEYERRVNLTTSWKRYSISFPLLKEKKKGFCVKIPREHFPKESNIWLDAVQLQKGKIAISYIPGNEIPSLQQKAASRRLIEIPTLKAERVELPPIIDGKLDEPCWRKSAKIEKFNLNTGNEPSEQTEAYVAHDAANLYIGFVCYDSQIDKLKSELKMQEETRDGNVWKDACVEVFLDTNHDKQTYYHFILNARGTQYDAKKHSHRMSSPNKKWNGIWQSKTTFNSNSWTAEIAIPLKSLDIIPGKNQTWGLNLCREYHSKEEYSTWSAITGSFHRPARFGNLTGLNLITKAEPFLIRELSYYEEILSSLLKIRMRVKNESAETKEIQLDAVLISPSTKGCTESKKVVLKAGDIKDIEMNIKTEEKGEHKLALSLLNLRTKNICYAAPVFTWDVKPPFSICSNLSYYTDEERAQIKIVNLLVSKDSLNGLEARLKLLRQDDKELILYKQKPAVSLLVEGISFDISKLTEGNYIATLELIDKTNKIITKANTEIRKLKKGDLITQTRFGANNELLVNGKPFFPIGTWVWDSYKLDLKVKDMAENGFNVVLFYDNVWGAFSDYRSKGLEALLKRLKDVLDIAYANKIKAIVYVRRLAYLFEEVDQGILEAFSAVKNHPAFLGWYIGDTVLDKTTKRNSQMYKAMKKLDPHHFAFSCIDGTPQSAPPSYLEWSDVVCVDSYPIPRRSILEIAERTKEVMNLAAGKKTVWIVPQLFGGTLHWFREPTPAEEEAMTYLAIVHGAKGILYWWYRPAYVPLWEKAGHLAREVRELSPILLSTDVEQQVTITPDNSPIHCLQKEYQGKTYLITVNSSKAPVKAEFSLPWLKNSSKIKVLFEDRELRSKKNQFQDSFQKFERHVYELISSQ